jgi:hypothetical protein
MSTHLFQEQLSNIRLILEDQLLEPVWFKFMNQGRAIGIFSEIGTLAIITFHPKGDIRRQTHVKITLYETTANLVAWFQCAFLGFPIFFRVKEADS